MGVSGPSLLIESTDSMMSHFSTTAVVAKFIVQHCYIMHAHPYKLLHTNSVLESQYDVR
jgi:hypothetical protein